MVITPTESLTQTVALWVSANGTDVGSYAITLMTGLEVVCYVLVLCLGMWLALALPLPRS